MSSHCDRIKEKLADMVVGALPPKEAERIADHLSDCASCSEYLRALQSDDERLIALADSLHSSADRIQTRVAAALAARERAESTPRDGFWRWIMVHKRPVFTAAAVAVALFVAWGAGRISGVLNGATPAFADVAEQIERARSVSYRQSLQSGNLDAFYTRVTAMEPGLMRTVMPYGDVIIQDFNTGKSLHLSAGCREAIAEQRVGAPERKRPYNYIAWLESLHKEGATFVRSEQLGDREVNVFVNKRDPYTTTTVWADASTDLPVRIEHVALPDPDKDVTVPKISLSESDFGGSPAYSQVVSQSGPGIVEKTTMVKDEFQWNVVFEDSLFDMTPPPGYALREYDLDTSPDDEARLVEALTLWTDMSQGRFPDAIEDLCEDEKVRPLLVAKFHHGGDPKEELKEAMAAANTLVGGLYFAQEMLLEGSWHYAGAGVRLGDAGKPVCWWLPEGAATYRVIYGDLRLADTDAEDLPE